MQSTTEKPTKKAYKTPQLVLYGNIRELTLLDPGALGMKDGASMGGGMFKTG